jgi:hypothetical protein
MTDIRNLQFDGLDRLDAAILKLRDDIGYVSVEEVLTRNKTEMVGRAEFSITELAAFMPTASDDEDEDEALTPSLGDLTAPPTGPTSEDLAVAMTRFVRHTIAANMTGCPRRIFKVSVWRPKGGGQYRSGRVVCTDPDFDEDEDLGFDEPDAPAAIAAVPALPPAPAATVVGQPVLHVDFLPEGRPWRALSDGYTNLIGLLQTSYNHLANLHTATIDGQNKQNIRLHRVMEALVTELTNLRLGLTEQADGRQREAEESRLNGELKKQFVEQLGALGRAYVGSKTGVPPELAALAEVLQSSPELMEALRQPTTIELLKHEPTQKQLANMLMSSGKRVAEAQSAAKKPPTPTPNLTVVEPPAEDE